MAHIEAGYEVVALKHRSDRPTWHQIFIKEHTKKRSDSDMPVGKTLYVLNVPPYVQSEHLAEAFAAAGEVSHVILADRKGVRHGLPNQTEAASQYFNKLPQLNTFKSAFVVFHSTKSLRVALKLPEVLLYNENDRTFLKTGVTKWLREYALDRPDEKAIGAEVEQYMAAFEQKEADERAAARAPVVDDDGWTTVKKGRGAGFEQKESTLKRLETKIEDGKKRKELQNFYTFQIRESKKQHVVGLRKRFEDDKRKIETMKKARNFKPY